MSFKTDSISPFTDGNSYLEYTANSNRLLAGNSVGLLKVFQLDQRDLEPTSVDIAENLTSISSFNDQVLITSTSGNLELVNISELESKGSVYRSELPLRDALFINEGKRIVAGGDDNKLVFINIRDDKSVVTIPIAEQLVNLSYCLNSEILTVSLANGNVELYSVINEQPNLIETIKSVLPTKIHSSTDEIDYSEEHKHELISTRCHWTKNGDYLFIPSIESIKQYNREWKSVNEFKIEEPLVDFQLSANSKFLAALTRTNKILLFELGTGKLLNSFQLDKSILINLVWLKDQLYLSTNDGGIITVSDFNLLSSKGLIDDEADDDGSNTDALDGNSDDEPHGINRNGIDDSIIDDDDSEEEFPYLNKNVDTVFDHQRTKRQKLDSPGLSLPVSQDIVPYSPGCTPFTKTSNSERRYLTMNSVGYVWAVKSDEANLQQSITVSFFDRSVNKDYHFSDYHKFDLCGVNSTGILLGYSNYKDFKPYGFIYYRGHESDQDSWDKKIPLSKGEYLTSVSLSDSEDTIIIVGTNFGYLRFYNKFGLCMSIIKTNPVVAVISSSANMVFIVTHLSTSLYSFSMIDGSNDYKFVQQDSLLPLKSDGKSPLLKGLFFNEYNDPCIVPGNDDTLVILSSWRESFNSRWIPLLNCSDVVADTTAKKSWKCWPLGIINDKLNCLLLKNGSQYPSFPLSMPVEFLIKLPINHIESKEQEEEEDHEENFVKAITMGKITSDSLTDTDYQEFTDEITDKLTMYSNLFDKSLLKLFADTCQEANLSKALAIAKMMKNDKGLIAASKICQRFEFNSLATKIGKLRDHLAEMEEL